MVRGWGTAWGNTGDEVHRISPVKDGQRASTWSSYVWVHLKTEADLLIFKRAGGEADGGEFGLGCGCDNDKRPGEISYGDQSNTCPALHELHSTQTRCGSRKCRVPAQEGGRPLPATATSPSAVSKPQIHAPVYQHKTRSRIHAVCQRISWLWLWLILITVFFLERIIARHACMHKLRLTYFNIIIYVKNV